MSTACENDHEDPISVRLNSNSSKQVFIDYPDILNFTLPTFEGDKYTRIITGSNLTVYRIVENNNKKYFDSIIPIKQFIYRGEDPLCRFFDITSLSQKDKNRLIEYSNRSDNPLVPISKVSTDFENYILIRMSSLGALPLVPEKSNILYDDELNEHMANIFNLIFKNRIECFKFIYDSFIVVSNGLMECAALYISDIAPNNILITCDLDRQKPETKGICNIEMMMNFIDILDLKKFRETMTVDMSRLFSVTRERLPEAFLKNLSDEALMLFPTYDQKNDEKEMQTYSTYMDELFKQIKRPRWIDLQKNPINEDFSVSIAEQHCR